MFFENSDDDASDDEGEWVLEEASASGDASLGELSVTSYDTTGSDEFFQVFDIDLEATDPESDGSTTGSPEQSETTPDQIESGTVTPTAPARTKTQYDRGTFVFPNDPQLMQAVEIRGKNGHGDPVETVYVLTGSSPTVPDRLFALHDPDHYASATRTSVSSYTKRMARNVARLFPDGETPNLIARFHTHPSGSLQPSEQDRQSARSVKRQFSAVFDGADFEFFHGIHSYTKLSTGPAWSDGRDATVNTAGISWDGESYRHELAVYGPKFTTPRDVAVTNDWNR